MNEPSKQNHLPADHKLDSALHALNSVQPAARLQQRIHARLAQESANVHRTPVWSGPFAKAATIFTWPRAAFALATFTAGVLAATLGLPLLHHPAGGPTASHTPAPALPSSGSGGAVEAGTATPATTSPVNAPPVNVHPGFTVRTLDGRAAALNTQGTVATVRSRSQHSDMQLASRKQNHVQARLAKPARPRPGQPAPAQTPLTDPNQPDAPAVH